MPDDRSMWASCTQCQSIVLDRLVEQGDDWVSLVFFLDAPADVQHILLEGLAGAREWSPDDRHEVFADHAPFIPLASWDRRCPRCGIRWLDDWWAQYGLLSDCWSCGLSAMLHVNRHVGSMTPFREIGFNLAEAGYAVPFRTIDAAEWRTECPTCGGELDGDPWGTFRGDGTHEPIARCAACTTSAVSRVDEDGREVIEYWSAWKWRQLLASVDCIEVGDEDLAR